MSAQSYELLRHELRPSERLIWGGCPRRGIHLRTGWVVFIAVIVIIDALLLAMTAFGPISTPPPGLITILVFATIVATLKAIEQLWDALRRRCTVYGLTDRRAIVLSGIVRPSTDSVFLDMITAVDVISRADQIGTIRCISVADGWYRRNRRKEYKPVPLFRTIVDPQHVHDLLVQGTRIQPANRLAGDPNDPESHIRIYNGPRP